MRSKAGQLLEEKHKFFSIKTTTQYERVEHFLSPPDRSRD